MLTIFNGALTGSFVPSNPFVIQGERITLDFQAVVTVGTVSIAFYLEFASENPLAAGTRWFREVAEEDAGDGVVAMPKVIRTFEENGGAALAIGTHRLSCHFVRAHQFGRIQSRVTGAGAAALTVFAPFGIVAISPST